jgi:hypothetical protein
MRDFLEYYIACFTANYQLLSHEGIITTSAVEELPLVILKHQVTAIVWGKYDRCMLNKMFNFSLNFYLACLMLLSNQK